MTRDRSLIDLLGSIGTPTMLGRNNAQAEYLNSDWTSLVVYDSERRGHEYVEEVLHRAGLICDIEDYQNSSDGEES